MRTLVAITVIASLAAPAAAGEPDGDRGPKDPTTAVEASVIGTAGSLVVMYAGLATHEEPIAIGGVALLVLAPSAGSWYSGKYVTRGLVWRTAGMLALYEGARTFDLCILEPCNHDNGAAALLLTAGTVGLFAGVAMDLRDAPRNARRYNRAHRHVTIVPTGAPGSVGLGVVGDF